MEFVKKHFNASVTTEPVDHSDLSKGVPKEAHPLLEQEDKMQEAYFAGGCFWCVTPIYKMYGVDQVICGYAGGDVVNPTYEQVKTQTTGHRETIKSPRTRQTHVRWLALPHPPGLPSTRSRGKMLS